MCNINNKSQHNIIGMKFFEFRNQFLLMVPAKYGTFRVYHPSKNTYVCTLEKFIFITR